MNPTEKQRYITSEAKAMHPNGQTTEDIATSLRKSVEYIQWVLQR